MRIRVTCFIGMTMAALLAACGGSSTSGRDSAEPPAGPITDVGKEAAARDAARRRQDPQATPPPYATEPPPEPKSAPDR